MQRQKLRLNPRKKFGHRNGRLPAVCAAPVGTAKKKVDIATYQFQKSPFCPDALPQTNMK